MSFSRAHQIFIIKQYLATQSHAALKKAFQLKHPDALVSHEMMIL